MADDDDGGGQGNGEQDWVQTLPESMREWDEVKNSDSPEAFAKQIGDLRSHLGNSIRIPGEDAGEEDRKSFLEKLQNHVPELVPAVDLEDPEAVTTILRSMGLPETVEGYKMPDLDTQGLEVDQNRVDTMLPIMHKLGITQKQAAGLIEAVAELDITASLNAEKAHKTELAELSEEWGVREDRRRDLVLSLATKTKAPEGLISAIKSGTVDAGTLRWMHGLVGQLSADGQEILNQHSDSGGITKEEAESKISETMNNKAHPYWVASHPRHQAALDQMVKLREIASA